MKKSRKYQSIYLIIFILIQLFILNLHVSLATENENVQSNEILELNETTNEEKQTIPDGTYVIRTILTEKHVLDVSQVSTANGANIQLFEYVKEDQQKFNVKYMNDGYYTIIAVHSGKVLDVAGAGQIPGTNVCQYELNNTDAQKWIIKEVEEGIYEIVSKCNGLYLDVACGDAKNGANIQVYTGNGTNAQKFIFEEVSESTDSENRDENNKADNNNNETIKGTQTIKDGNYAIKTVLSNKYGLDVNQASKGNGANIQLFEYVKENQQIFNVKHIGDGYYTITAIHSGKVLDVAGAGKTPGTNVCQYESNNTDAQKWIIKEVGDGSYNIISKCNGLYLDVVAGQAKNGTNIHMYTENGTNAQKFIFEEATFDGTYVIRTALNNKYTLDVNQASIVSGANIQLFEETKENQQRFKIESIEEGYYKIIAMHSGKVLDVAGAGKTPGTNVCQYESNNSDAQKWLIKYAGDGCFNIISKCNGLYLDVSNGQAKNNANIQVYTGNGTDAQKFEFVENNISYQEGTYGKSGLAIKGDSRGTDLKYYKFGQGENVMFATFSVHGFEDSYNHDGAELTYIAEQFKTRLAEKFDYELYRNWTIYIFPTVNPDGQTYGWTNNGEGRTTLYSAAPNNKGIDINRNFQTSDYVNYKDNRNYNGTEAFQAYEARYLRDFLLNNKSQNGQTILIDLHGWLDETIGDYDLGAFYRNEFGMTKHIYTYGKGYLVNWARMSLGNSNKTARSALIELPQVNNHEQLVSEKHAEKYINATINMLKSIV